MNQDSMFSNRYIWTSMNTSTVPSYNKQRDWDILNEPEIACATCGKQYPAHLKRYSKLALHMDGHAGFKLPERPQLPLPSEFLNIDPF